MSAEPKSMQQSAKAFRDMYLELEAWLNEQVVDRREDAERREIAAYVYQARDALRVLAAQAFFVASLRKDG